MNKDEFTKTDIPQWANTYACLHGARLCKDHNHTEAMTETAEIWFDIGFKAGRIQGQEEAYEFFISNDNLRLAAPLFSEWQASDEYKKLMGEG